MRCHYLRGFAGNYCGSSKLAFKSEPSIDHERSKNLPHSDCIGISAGIHLPMHTAVHGIGCHIGHHDGIGDNASDPIETIC